MVDEDELTKVLAGRLGDDARAKELTAAYLSGMAKYAIERTTGQGGVPTTLVGERVELLLHVSKQLGHLITEREIAALLRVNPGTARRLHIELRSVHEDTVRPFVYRYALQNAKTEGKGEYDGVVGMRVAFATEEQMEAFLTEAERTSLLVARKRDETNLPWLLYVHSGFDPNLGELRPLFVHHADVVVMLGPVDPDEDHTVSPFLLVEHLEPEECTAS